MARILVTGGSGFIGSAVVRGLAERGDEVLAVDVSPSPAIAELTTNHPRQISFAPGDLTEWAQMAQAVKAFRPGAIVHCAAVVGVVNSLAAPVATMRVNV